MSELYELSAVDTLRAFQDRSISPSEYLEAILERIEVAQPPKASAPDAARPLRCRLSQPPCRLD